MALVASLAALSLFLGPAVRAAEPPPRADDVLEAEIATLTATMREAYADAFCGGVGAGTGPVTRWFAKRRFARDKERYLKAKARRAVVRDELRRRRELTPPATNIMDAAMAARTDPDATNESAVTAFALFLNAGGPVPDESRRVAALCRILAANEEPVPTMADLFESGNGFEGTGFGAFTPPEAKAQETIRRKVVALLAPKDDPARFKEPEIDAALERSCRASITSCDAGGFWIHSDADVEDIVTALAARDSTNAYDLAAAALDRGKRLATGEPELAALAVLARRHPERYRARLLAFIRDELAATTHSRAMVFGVILFCDLRELAPELEQLATASPDDAGETSDWVYATLPTARPPSPSLAGKRFRLPRLILDYWRATTPGGRSAAAARLNADPSVRRVIHHLDCRVL